MSDWDGDYVGEFPVAGFVTPTLISGPPTLEAQAWMRARGAVSLTEPAEKIIRRMRGEDD